MSKMSSLVQVWERKPFQANIHGDRRGYAVRRSAKNNIGFVVGTEREAGKKRA